MLGKVYIYSRYSVSQQLATKSLIQNTIDKKYDIQWHLIFKIQLVYNL